MAAYFRQQSISRPESIPKIPTSEGVEAGNIEMERNAAEQVFDTVELMEMILFGLPMRTLFTMQATNKTFCDSIKNSVKLRRAMFLEPELETSTNPPPAKLNPLLYATMLLPGQEEQDGISGYYRRPPRSRPVRGSIDAWTGTQANSTRIVKESAFLRLSFKPQTQFLCVPRFAGSMLTSKRPHEGGSWRQMVAVQYAPAAEILVKIGGSMSPCYNMCGERKGIFGQGCTLEELHDWVQDELGQWRREREFG